ncbi:MAG: hypothetical protein P8H28_08135 [Porticoccaceae bacterium]|nr:hypothetical protein [Porticoccaceae bacterium]
MLKSRKLKLFARDILHLQNNIKELILQKAVNMEMVGESVSQSILNQQTSAP